MLNQDDLKYLRWIAQRLTNRYREDPKVIIIVDNIISKIIAENSINKSYRDFILKSISDCEQNLQEIISYTDKLPSVSDETSKQIIIDKNTNTFENMDISEIFK